MIVLDTNVISELVKMAPDSRVMAWINQQHREALFLPTVALAELFEGVAILPEGRRKRDLQDAIDRRVSEFNDRVLPFDAEAARRYAQLYAAARSSGLGFPLPDAYIAAIASSRSFAVASRDTGPYMAGGIHVIDPWQHQD